ncbi:hypothetical protein L208DRAFT_1500211 [Tricholoma matsutake]|nr:hypothetical protein L208DRAFT_1500211 [Tricholoma matsutake 945]
MSMRFIFCRAELLDLKLSCFWAQTSPICLHPSNHLVFPLPDRGKAHCQQAASFAQLVF